MKIPRKGQLDREETEKFLREARAAAQLQHPGIVGVHEVGIEGETVYIVSDFIEGLSLDKWLEGQRPTPRKAAELCIKIAEALHHAHEKGVIHRDLKPGNIMFDAAGETHVMDFGLAKREAGEITMTVEGQIMGTPAYMSPEQAKGEGHRVDRRTDVYSLGAVLFELLTGERPFRGNVRMLLKQVIEDEAPSLRKLDARVPRDLETICLKCLQKEPRRRYPTAQELVDELRRYLDGKPIRARRIGRAARAWRWCKRYPVLTTMGLALLIALASGTAISTYFGIAARHESEAAQENLRLATENLAIAEEGAYNVQLARAAELWRESPERAIQTLTDTDRCPLRLREFTWGLLYGLCDRRKAIWRIGDDPISALAFSPDGRLLAVVCESQRPDKGDQNVRLLDVNSGQRRRLLRGHTDTVTTIAFSPSRPLFASGSRDGTVRLWDTDQFKVRVTLPAGRAYCLAFHPNSDLLATAAEGQTIRVWDSVSGKQLASIGTTENAAGLRFWPIGRRLAAIVGEKLRMWDLSADTPNGYREVASDPFGNHVPEVPRDQTAAISPDGMTVASLENVGNTHLRDFCARRPHAIFFESRSYNDVGTATPNFPLLDASPCFSPASDMLAVPSQEDAISILDSQSGKRRVCLPQAMRTPEKIREARNVQADQDGVLTGWPDAGCGQRRGND